MDGRSLRPSEVLSTPLSTPELPTDCGDWLADRAPWSACLGSPAGSPLGGGRGEGGLRTFLALGLTPTSSAPAEQQRASSQTGTKARFR